MRKIANEIAWLISELGGIILLLMIIATVIVSIIVSIFGPKIKCEKHVGSAYIYDSGQCYRLLEDYTLQSVNVNLEKKIEEAKERHGVNKR